MGKAPILNETIAAIATPPGEGGVAIIRISGKEAIAVAMKLFSGRVQEFESHRAYFGKILREENVIDEGLLIVMRGPRSYTGEDVVEIQCHGGRLIARRVLESAFHAGARAAEAGEFTLRAYLNGRLDLAQAEAVQALIHARNDAALSVAQKQLEGQLSETIRGFQEELVDLLAEFEARLDFPEEGIDFSEMKPLKERLSSVKEKMERLALSYHKGKRLYDGLTVSLAGPPNAGKSSLMNALIGRERAIVTPLPGTTRDLLEEEVALGPYSFRLIDTAGLRSSEETVEIEGIRRARTAMTHADLVLFLFDGSETITLEERALMDGLSPEKTLLIWNKADLPQAVQPALPFAQLSLSAKEGKGLGDLEKELMKRLEESDSSEVVISSLRHKSALEVGARLLGDAENGHSLELIACDLRAALIELNSFIGQDVQEEVLSAIFSKFCVGK